MAGLFSTLQLRGLSLPNRVMMSPMCMYSAGQDGCLTDWHIVHYLTRVVGGVGLVMMEATAVEPRGRITLHDLGLWDDAQVPPLATLVTHVHNLGGRIGVQLAHAGRKAWSRQRGWGPAQPVGPTSEAFDTDWQPPLALDTKEITKIINAWQEAARRAATAKLDVVEIHAAHGYLIHQFLSPLSNKRTDTYGGSRTKRMRLLVEIVEAVRDVWDPDKPLFVRLSATDWHATGLTVEDTTEIARTLRTHGVDLIDCSSGGLTPTGQPDIGPGYQVPFAAQVRREANIATAAVGLITSPEHAAAIIHTEQADIVALGRELLRHPYWVFEAAHTLGQEIDWPVQYIRAKW